ncbi:MAG: symmetrical bis(5'-nucleosyl)-tetraphosphatase [Steroidobacteraceae bacterium]|nr:symmetrical bis(5'-nucleosyl)-tetraphosphatase [Nevskiaceae bacterium]MCP5339408.1 symmetrical bis(5'-nucleosyl)-tetraphosphatase [Nevskiaceae bacterium]MCP5360518.1 symmetrical bis(5'-nucleosyl)-tetraphosphatase [Nevskiaceae bacterium]MCP5472864.1 symmetrical bis(5'-nucleosyl)-tetraphosphatase [Nevskiaceae bacterium]
MTRIAIGDVQGCGEELRALVARTGFSADRDQLWFVGDLVNRGPQSLDVLRWVRSLGDAAIVVLGNHDLHLLAVAYGGHRRLRAGDTLEAILAARDRDSLLEWLLHRPLAWQDDDDAARPASRGDVRGDLLVHAGLVPQWSGADALRLAAEVEQQLRRAPEALFATMYGNQPDRWDESLTGPDRWRVVINVLTRMRFCRANGRIDLRHKGAPGTQPEGWLPWFDVPSRASADRRVICGHWSTLGLLQRPDLLALDTGCVWGGALTAVSLDDERCWQLPCRGHQTPGDD